jgi:hypothetical protein
MMDERRRQRRHEQRAAGPFDAALKALLTDPVLATRASVALAVPLAAGAVGGLALLLLAGLTSGATLGGCLIAVGGVLGLALALLALGLRRDRAEQTRAPWRINVALGTVALAVVAFAMRAMPMSLPFALALGVVVALLAIGCGLWTGVRVEREIRALARERRAAWHAQIRASRLTRRMLGYRAYRQLRRDGALPVESTIHPGRRYLVPIRTTPSGARILVMDGDRPIGGLCSRPRQPLPDPEEALTHILAIRTDERAWLARANFFPQDRALTPQARGLAPGRPGNYER